MRRFFHLALFILLPACLLWGAGFAVFLHRIPDAPSDSAMPVDAAVVLTGGAMRLDEGFRLLQTHRIKRLFISGVGKGVSAASLLGEYQYQTLLKRCCGEDSDIVLGYEATNTLGNARETKHWLDKEGYTSIRLITAHYHMPRSLLLFHKVLGKEIRIIPHPVFPPQADIHSGWKSPRLQLLLIHEYHKYLWGYVVYGLGQVADI